MPATKAACGDPSLGDACADPGLDLGDFLPLGEACFDPVSDPLGELAPLGEPGWLPLDSFPAIVRSETVRRVCGWFLPAIKCLA